MSVALTCIALLGLLLFGLGNAVSFMRGNTNTIIGHSPDPTDRLHKLVRAHGNTAEYAPLLGVLMLALAIGEPARWMLWVMGIATASRYLIVIGMIASPTL
ncbi:MAG: MAPEG family protein, partial [Myxococcota bacterium]